MENFPITDTRNNFVLEFLDYFVGSTTLYNSRMYRRGLTHSVPLKKVEIILYRSRARRF
jgi:DNA-directed RNA polymerase subunit beta